MHLPIALGLLFVGLASLVFALVTHACARKILTRQPVSGSTPPISVLKPLKGADEDLFANLSSLAAQDYPNFEILFGCEDAMDPALGVARRVQLAHPNVRTTLVAGGKGIGHNPKVNNLAALVKAARHDWVLVSDADVRVAPDYLRAMASETADPRVGLVSSVISAVEDRSLGATLDCLHMNGFIVSSVCGAEVLCGHPCVIGKSMLFRRSDLERLGGLGVVKDVLAEDYVLGATYHRAGFRVALSGHAIRAISGTRTVSAFFKRHLRWSQMRRHLRPALYLGEPLLLPTPWLLGAAMFALSAGAGRLGGIVVAISVLLLAAKSLSDFALSRRLPGKSISISDSALVPLKDLLIVLAWLLGWFKSTVEWRGTTLRIGAGSMLSRLGTEEGTRAARRAF